MSHVLIASDGSECSKAAQNFVASLPFRKKPDAKLIAATPLPVTLSEYYVESVLFEQAHHTQNTVVAPRANAEAERLRPQFASVTTDLRIGDPANEILDAAEESKADLIVLGARGLSAIPRFLLGSVSDYVCRHAHQSVLVVRVPHGSEAHSRPLNIPPRRILFATDGSDAANQAIDRFASWKWPADAKARVIIAHQVVTAFGIEITQVDEPYCTAERLKAEAILQSASQRLNKAFTSVETEINPSSQIAHTIVEEAEKWNADLIVIGNRGLSRWERFLLGSTSLGVLHHAPCSVWVEKHS
jgi:nucleotide-binding universal stress UspA family protein